MPKNVEFKIATFEDWNEDLLSIDLKEDLYIRKVGGTKKAIVIQFELNKSCYATMMVREITRGTTNFVQKLKTKEIPKPEEIQKNQ